MASRSGHFDEIRLAWEYGVDEVVGFCETLPNIGGQPHLAKNLVVHVAKPDIWLEIVAENSGETGQKMCSVVERVGGQCVDH
ncbi:hypothetical protein X767_14610 [Mesorhizobium sp. LSJC264A00]|nr:hypothetical protein X767_14610 [Mesorhizobium sp. LSJC264A00]